MVKRINKKFKGFTIVELLAVIVILAVIITIGVVSFLKIKDNLLKQQKENLIETIEISARKYYEETGSKKIPVEILIQGGYIQGEETEDNEIAIIDPVSKKSLNCSYVDFTEDEEGKFVESEVCETTIIADAASEIQYCISKNDNCNSWINISTASEWIGLENDERFFLRTTLDGAEYNWITELAPDKQGTKRVYEVVIPNDKVINGEYKVSFNYNEIEYSAAIDLKIDARNPVIENTSVSEGDTWATKKYFTATVLDSESGLKDYAIMRDTSKPGKSDWNAINGNSFNINEELTNNGSLYLWVRDNALHVTKSSEIVVSKIDNTAPIMTITVENGTTYSKSKEGIVKITDLGNNGEIVGFTNNTVEVKYKWDTVNVNCNTMTNYDIATLTLSSTNEYTGTINISGKTGQGKLYVCPNNTISDALGNTLANSVVSDNMYLDNTGPSASFSVSRNSSYAYNSKTASYTIKSIKDDHSGLDKMCITESADSSSCSTWETATNATNKSFTFNASDGSGKTVTLYLHIKDVLGNITTKSANYTLYTYCTEKSVSKDTGYGLCSEKCGSTGRKSKTLYYSDTYFTSHDCGSEIKTTTCTATTSDSNCGNWAWSTCSASCGDGTKYQYRTCTKISDEDGTTNCGTVTRYQNENTKCNLGSCEEGIYAYRYNGCDVYYITTCTSTTCKYTIKNAASDSGTISRSSLTTSPSNCNSTKSYCSAWINSRSGNIVSYSVTGNKVDCTLTGYSTGCSKYSMSGNTFKVNVNKNSCSVTANLSGIGYIWNKGAYNYISWTAVKCSGKVCTDSCSSYACA